MKFQDMIKKAYTACLSKKAKEELAAKEAAAAEKERLAFIENNKVTTVLSPLAQAILDTLKARIEAGHATVQRSGVFRYSSASQWDIRDEVAGQVFTISVYCEQHQGIYNTFQRVIYDLKSPLAFSGEEGSLLSRYLMEFYEEFRDKFEKERREREYRDTRYALTMKYMSGDSVTKE